MKRVLTLLFAAFITSGAFAQGAAPAESSILKDPMFPYYIVIGVIFIVTLLVLAIAIYIIRILNILSAQAEKANAEKQGITYAPRATWWDQITQQLNASVPVEQEKDIVMDHNYDGIRELDNHLPPWWKWLFYATIVFSGFYVVFYHFSGTLPLQEEEYQAELLNADETKRKFLASQPQAVIDETTLTYSNDAAIIEQGKAVFNNNCIACHRNDGGGNTIGPNLTDAYWLHGGDVKEIFSTVKNGVVDKGMPAWGKAMSPKDVRDVTFFVLSLQGTNPVGGKAPQGTLVEAKKVVATDSTAAIVGR